MVRIAFEKDEEKSKVMLNTFETETLPNFLKNMENLLISRGGKHFAGNEVQLIILDWCQWHRPTISNTSILKQKNCLKTAISKF